MSNEQSMTPHHFTLQIKAWPVLTGRENIFENQQVLQNAFLQSLTAHPSFFWLFPCFSDLLREHMKIDDNGIVSIAEQNDAGLVIKELSARANGNIECVVSIRSYDEFAHQARRFISVGAIAQVLFGFVGFFRELYLHKCKPDGFRMEVAISDAKNRQVVLLESMDKMFFSPIYRNAQVITASEISIELDMTPVEFSKNSLELYAYIMQPLMAECAVSVNEFDLMVDFVKWLNKARPISEVALIVGLSIEQVQKLAQLS